MLMNCPRGWFLWGFPPEGAGAGVAPDGAGAWLGVCTGAAARVIGDAGLAGLTGRACRRLR
jgi:hypothetical protein